MKRRRGRREAAVGLLATCVASAGTRADGDVKTVPQKPAKATAPIQQEPSMDAHSPDMNVVLRRRFLQLLHVWRSRSERDVAPELMRFLQDKHFDVRYEAAIFLGYLEYGPAEEPLRVLLEQPTEAEKNDLDPQRRLRLQLALARIRARDLKGQAKVEAVAVSIGRRLDTLMPERGVFALGVTSPEDVVRHEVFELLYDMAKKGENIEPLKNKLRSFGSYTMLLEGASLPSDVEVTRLLDYLEKQEIANSGPVPKYYLPNMGPRALNLLLVRLQQMLEHPERHFKSLPPVPSLVKLAEEAEEIGDKRDLSYLKRPRYAGGYQDLFDVAARSDDARFLPILKRLEAKFQNDPDTMVHITAQRAREQLQERLQLLQTPEDAIVPLK